MSYLFFTSYARVNRSKPARADYLRRFIEEIEEEVRQRGPHDTDEISFFDSDAIQVGMEWENKLEEALRISRVCLALCSPAYFDSEYCGKEFHVFASRLSAARKDKAADLDPVIFPLLWMPCSTMPEAIRKLQYANDDLPKSYAEVGIREMMQLRKYRQDYRMLTARLAEKLIAAATQHGLPEVPSISPLKETPSAFHFKKTAARAHSNSGVRKACFVFLAAQQAEVAAVRNVVLHYGTQDAWEWMPYYPDHANPEDSVGALSQLIAGERGLRFQDLPVRSGLADRLRQANRNSIPTVLIADAWSAGIPKYGNFLQEYDELLLSNCALIVPWNDGDDETRDNRANLAAALRAVCPQKTETPPPQP